MCSISMSTDNNNLIHMLRVHTRLATDTVILSHGGLMMMIVTINSNANANNSHPFLIENTQPHTHPIIIII